MEDLGVQISPKSSPTTFLHEWMSLARHSKRLHEAVATDFTARSDAGLVTAVVLGSAGELINILLGAVSAEYGSGAAINVSQVAFDCISVVYATIVSLSKQLGWESQTHMHAEYASHHGELARLISSERTLSTMNDSSYASIGDFM